MASLLRVAPLDVSSPRAAGMPTLMSPIFSTTRSREQEESDVNAVCEVFAKFFPKNKLGAMIYRSAITKARSGIVAYSIHKFEPSLKSWCTEFHEAQATPLDLAFMWTAIDKVNKLAKDFEANRSKLRDEIPFVVKALHAQIWANIEAEAKETEAT
jgi:hypothetical protein